MTLAAQVASYWLVAFSVALVALILGGVETAVSAFAGGVAVALPGTFFAVTLAVRAQVAPSAAYFFLGEGVKVVATLVLLIVAVKLLGHPVWLALIAGLALTAKAGWLSIYLSMRGNHGSFWARTHSL